MPNSKKQCLDAMRNAPDYATWREAAAEFDRLSGAAEWRTEDQSADYDWQLLRSRLRQIRQCRAEGAHHRLIHHLRQDLHRNLGNLGNATLYLHSLTGTKRLIEEYVAAVVEALNFVCDHRIAGFDHAAKLRFFEETAHSFGRSSLLLSGGATLGLFHVGVVKTLVEQSVLPGIISGSSAGALVAAVLGTQPLSEFRATLSELPAQFRFWQPLRPRQMLRQRALMNQHYLRHAIEQQVPDLTFEEAYQRSGIIIDITISPAGVHQSPRLLNYLTYPYVFLREAVLASCAVPLLFPPVMLMTRNEAGQRVPYLPRLRWTDGSLKSDLPGERLRRLHNVNHFIVSQTNPHVLPFMSRKPPDHPGLLRSARNYAYSTVRLQTREVLNLWRANLRGRVRGPLDAAAAILDQHYSGHVTILPELSLWRYLRVARNPDEKTIRRFVFEGERATWPRLAELRNQTLIATTFEQCLRRLAHGAAIDPAVEAEAPPRVRARARTTRA